MAFAVKGDGVGFATESYAVSALYTTLANLSADLWRIRRASCHRLAGKPSGLLPDDGIENDFLDQMTLMSVLRLRRLIWSVIPVIPVHTVLKLLSENVPGVSF